MVADPGLERVSFDSHLKTSHTTPCYYLSHSDSGFNCKTSLSALFHSVLFCSSLFRASCPCYTFSVLWNVVHIHPFLRLGCLHFSLPSSPFFFSPGILPLPGRLPEPTSSVFQCFLALRLFSPVFGLYLVLCCSVSILEEVYRYSCSVNKPRLGAS